MHPVTCTWAPKSARVVIREGRRAWFVPANELASVVGLTARGRLRLRGILTLILFDDKWSVLIGETV